MLHAVCKKLIMCLPHGALCGLLRDALQLFLLVRACVTPLCVVAAAYCSLGK
jgi:hypothetical protein